MLVTPLTQDIKDSFLVIRRPELCLSISQQPTSLLGCWSNNVANNHPSPGPFNCRVLRSCLVPQCSHSPHWPHHQRRLANCDWMPASYSSGQSSYPRRRPACWTSSQSSPTASSLAWLMTGGRQHHTSATLPTAFHEDSGGMLFWGRQNMCRHLRHTPEIYGKIAGEWKNLLQFYGQDKNRTGCPPALDRLFRSIFSQGTWKKLFQADGGLRCPSCLCIYFCLSACVWRRSPQFNKFSVPFQYTMPLDTNESAKEHVLDQRLWTFQVRFHRSLQSYEPSVFWQLGRLRLQWGYFYFPNATHV